jgi:hypothetical protein
VIKNKPYKFGDEKNRFLNYCIDHMKKLNFLLLTVLALSIAAACSKDESSAENPLIGKWKVIEENDPWDYDLIHTVDYYRVWEFFPNGTVKYYNNSDNIDNSLLKTYELKSDSLYIYYENIKDELNTHIYSCRFIDEEKNKIRIEYLQGIRADIMQPSVWIYERVNE